MRKPFWLLGVAALMATLVSCNRNAKPEPAVYEWEVYKTQEILVNPEDRGTRYASRTRPLTLLDIDGKDVLVFSYSAYGETNSYYDLATGKKMYELDKAEDVELVREESKEVADNVFHVKAIDLNTLYFDTIMPTEVQLATSNEKLYVDTVFREKNDMRRTFIYDKTNDVYYHIIAYDSEYYGKHVHTCVLADKDFNYIGEIYNERGIWCSNDRIAINYDIVNDSIIKLNYLRLTKTDRDYKQYIDSCRADLEKRHKDWEDYKVKFAEENSPVVALVKSKNEIDGAMYKIITFYCKNEVSDADRMVIDSLIARKEIVNLAPIYIVVSAENEELAASYIKDNGLDCIDKIVFDTEGIAKTDAGQANPRLMLVEDGLITKDIVYSTEDIAKKMIPRVFGVGSGMQYDIYCEMLVVRGTHPDYFFDD